MADTLLSSLVNSRTRIGDIAEFGPEMAPLLTHYGETYLRANSAVAAASYPSPELLKYYSRYLVWNQLSFGQPTTAFYSSSPLYSAKSNDIAIFLGSGSTTYYTTSDGITFTARTAPTTFDKVFYLNDRFFAFTNGSSHYSLDGITWVSSTLRATANQTIYDMCYGNGLYVAVCTGGVISTSPDGVSWTNRSSGVGTAVIAKVYYGGSGGASNRFVAVCNGDSTACYVTTSSNGTSWTANNVTTVVGDATSSVRAVGFYSGKFFIHYDNVSNRHITASDAVAWSYTNLPATVGSSGVVNDRLWMISNGGAPYYTTDNSTWVTVSGSYISQLPLYVNGWWILPSTQSFTYTSSDGITFRQRSTPAMSRLMEFSTRIVGLGGSGKVYNSAKEDYVSLIIPSLASNVSIPYLRIA